MKKILLVLIMSMAFLSTPAKAAYNNNISADPFSLINWGRFNITYEHKVSRINSFTVFFESYNKDYHKYWNGYGIGGSYRWYISPFNDRKTSLEGFSFGPLAILSFWNTDGYYRKVGKNNVFYKDGTGSALTIGGEAAYKWVWGGFSLEPSIVLLLDVKGVDDRGDIDPLSLNVKIGYAW